MGLKVKQKCFVIMPFSKTSDTHTEEYWTNHYDKFLKPLIESVHPLIAERSSPLRGDIVRQIITDLVTAPIVVADLTDANPNVYWELGVRQSFRHCTITVAEEETDLPFDIFGKGSLFYFPSNHIKMQEFEKKFHEAIDDCLKNPGIPDSHVLETISGRGTLHQILMRDESLRKLDALLSEIKYNEGVIDACNKNIKENKGKGGGYVTRLFLLGSAETLRINRYIDADETFYAIAENYTNWLICTNDRISAWPSRPETIEPWLLETLKDVKLRIDKFKELVTKHKKAIETIL